jgi:translation initiation factor 2B subunit (eIF-2B alpha/beta/delta family)
MDTEDRPYIRLLGLQGRINEIAGNNQSGASEILQRAAGIYSIASAASLVSSVGEGDRVVREISEELMNAQRDMAPLLNLVRVASRAAGGATEPGEALRLAARAAEEYAELTATALTRSARNMADLISDGSTVLAHSRSSTVLAALKLALTDGKSFKLIVTESRPICEGRIVAEALSREGVTVSLIADAAVAIFLHRVDFVVVGADKITPEYLVNKIGTQMISLAARESNRRMYAVADTSKFINMLPVNAGDDYHDTDELWPSAPPGIAVLNRYFEQTPLNLFSGIVTEEGTFNSSEASERAAWNTLSNHTSG